MSKRKHFDSVCECHMSHVLGEDLPEGKICECHECSEEARINFGLYLYQDLKLSRERTMEIMGRFKWTT